MLSGKDFEDLFELRLLSEPGAARAATRVSAADLDMLDALLGEMRKSRHEMLRRLHAHTRLYRLYFRGGIAEATCREHERIVEALRDRDPITAEAAMRSHLTRAKERLLPAAGDVT